MSNYRNKTGTSGGSAVLRGLGRLIFFLLWTVLLTAVVLLGMIYVMEKGPSPTLTATFCRSMRETSAIRWIPDIFLSEEEIDGLKSENTENDETQAVNTSLIHVAAGEQQTEKDDFEPELQLIEIADGTVKGKLLIVKDPSRVILGTSDNLGKQAGLQLTALVAKYNGIAGTNAGGFNDENGLGNGGIPQGLVITGGELVWGGVNTTYNLIGFDENDILHVGRMTGMEALNLHIRDAVSFVTHDGLASALIINGEVQTKNLVSGVNPRTAIGQRADGAVLMLVIDGRQLSSAGATYDDLIEVMLQFGAVNAMNLDGGSSTVMYLNGELVNQPSSLSGYSRGLPDAFMFR